MDPSQIKNQDNNAIIEESKKWRRYAAAVTERDEHRKKAEQWDKERRASWRKYYALDKEIKKLDYELGIADMLPEDNPMNYDPSPGNPAKPCAAPRKRRLQLQREIDLTEE